VWGWFLGTVEVDESYLGDVEVGVHGNSDAANLAKVRANCDSWRDFAPNLPTADALQARVVLLAVQ
jgi:hypothetical protein